MKLKAYLVRLLFCVFLPAQLVFAQPRATRLYTLNDGLPNTSFSSFYQDKYGYLWIGTPTGLCRFDGRQFTTFGLDSGLPSVYIVSIFQDDEDRLWVAVTGGMAQFKGDRFITYPTSDGAVNIYTFNFFETSKKQIWALTDKGVYEFAGTTWKKIALFPGYDNKVCRGAAELNGKLYIIYPTELVCRDRGGKWIHIASSRNENVFNRIAVQDKQVWLTEGAAIYQIINDKLIPLPGVASPERKYISYLVDNRKQLWISARDTLKISKGNDWKHFTPLLTGRNNFHFISQDSAGNVWTTTTRGLLKIKNLSFSVIDKKDQPLVDGIYNMIALPGNKILLSSGIKNGLMVYRDGHLVRLKLLPGSNNKHYNIDPADGFAFDSAQKLWMTTRFGRLLCFDGKRLSDYTGRLALKTTEGVYGTCYDKGRDQIFICADSTLKVGVAGNTKSRFVTFIPKNTGVPIIKPTRIFYLSNGLLLLYVDAVGVFCIDAKDNLIPLIRQTGFNAKNRGTQAPVIFFEDSSGFLWLTAPGLGLFQYDLRRNGLPQLANHLGTDDGLQGAKVLGLTEDRHKRIWVATNSGVDVLQKNTQGKWEIFNYARTADLNFNEADVQKLVTDTRGNIWLSSPDKIIKFQADSIQLVKHAPRIIIEKVSLAFKETNWSTIARRLYSYYQLPVDPMLRYDQNSLGVFFNAIDLFASNSDPQFSYKLFPVDTGWSTPSRIRYVSLTELPPGKYKFLVRARDAASGWSPPAEFRFGITPPFWASWWFRLGIVLMASFIILAIFRLRLNKIKKDAFIENQLRELEMKALKAQMNPHFIYNALNSIQALVENDKKNDGIRYIGSFSRLLRQVLENAENNVTSLDKELETIGLYIQLESLRLDVRLQYKKEIAEDMVPEFEKIPPLILQPFVENALWHGLSHKEGEKEISISVVSINDKWLICSVTDNGVGRAKAAELKNRGPGEHRSRGIEITRKRLEEFNNDKTSPITFTDLVDDDGRPLGTTVSIRIKRKIS